MFLYLHLHLRDGLDWAPRTCRSSRPSVCTTEDFVPGKHCPVDAATMKHSEGDMQVQMKNQQTHPLGWDCHFLPGFWESVADFDVRPCYPTWVRSLQQHKDIKRQFSNGTTIGHIAMPHVHLEIIHAEHVCLGSILGTPNRNPEVYILLCQLERMVVAYIACKFDD